MKSRETYQNRRPGRVYSIVTVTYAGTSYVPRLWLYVVVVMVVCVNVTRSAVRKTQLITEGNNPSCVVHTVHVPFALVRRLLERKTDRARAYQPESDDGAVAITVALATSICSHTRQIDISPSTRRTTDGG